MFHLRRYRVFVACAVIFVFLLYRVSISSAWDDAVLYKTAGRATDKDHGQKPLADLPPSAEHGTPGEDKVKLPNLKPDTEIQDGFALPVPQEPPAPTDPPVVVEAPGKDKDTSAFTTTVVHWQQPPEWFPVPKESLISLPTGKPKSIPRVQHAFGPEDPKAKKVREHRLAQVKAEMKHAWDGYAKSAFGHDELKPISNGYHDPFAGWGATLVDAMDALWIMGLKEEFDRAYRALADIDFTTTPYRSEIPVFETTIRYLGGFLAAYDLTGGHKGDYPLLLKKAVELAEILMGIFDTPNRMPDLAYKWKPQYAFQPKRASTHAGIAELGSLSMEFTRLAQLTGRDKYYDGVARITDALEEWQNRKDGTAPAIPGIFPENVDASGCNRTATNELKAASAKAQKQAEAALLDAPQGYVPPAAGSPETGGSKHSGKRGVDEGILPDEAPSHKMDPRAKITSSRFQSPETSSNGPVGANGLPVDWDCVAQNLTAGPGSQKFSMGGSQDSAYEYFPKQYILLGGLEPKYRTMHEGTVAAVKKWLLYRPMAPDDPDILFSAQVRASYTQKLEDLSYVYEVTHLTCFLGGMFGLGAKIFDTPEDLEIGKRLTEGCVWAYSAMPSGIMPETSQVVPCSDAKNCHWNETVWFDEYLDPDPERRTQQMEDYFVRVKEWEAEKEKLIQKEAERLQAAEEVAQGEADERGGESAKPALDPSTLDQKGIAAKVKELEAELGLDDDTTGRNAHGGSSRAKSKKPVDRPNLRVPSRPVKPKTHDEVVAERIKSEALVPGFTQYNDKRYILRPEAIESVWYMYRITGDPIWQEKGWNMWRAIVKHTHTAHGAAAVDHVNSRDGHTTQIDSMESFWLAETLKYFYLLYSDPDLVNLDDWVLNTEAHPFKRPT